MITFYMRGKRIGPNKRSRILKMISSGMTITEITKKTGISRPTITKIRDENLIPEDVVPEEEENQERIEISETPENKKSQKGKRTLDTETQRKFITKASDDASNMTETYFQKIMKEGVQFTKYRDLYEDSLSKMGCTWEDFVDASLKLGYSLMEDAYIEEVRKRQYEDHADKLLKMDIEEKLHEQIIEGIKNER